MSLETTRKPNAQNRAPQMRLSGQPALKVRRGGRAPPKAKSCAKSCGASSAPCRRERRRRGARFAVRCHVNVLPPCPAPRPSRARPLRVAQGQRGGRYHDEHLHAPVLRGTLHVLRHQSAAWGAACVCWAWVPPLGDSDGQDKHLHAPVLRGDNTPCATSCATPCAASFTCPSFTCRPRAAWGAVPR